MAAESAGGQLTPQQQRAVTLRGVSIVLSSGAGCGKTHVLTERYLSHLRDDGAEVSQVVAITFTDRAARQMRERIRRALMQELRRAASDDAVVRWSGHLRGLETAPISTIHAFCGTLLRQHAVEVGLDPRFDVLEDALSANFEIEALTFCLQELLTAPTLVGEDLRQLVLLYGWRTTVEAIQHLMRSWSEQPWQAWLQQTPDALAQRWQEQDRAALLPRYIEYLLAASPKIAHCLALLRNTPCQGPETRARVDRLLNETPRLATAPDLAAAVEELHETAKVGKERAKAWPSPEVYATVQKAFEGFRKELPDRLQLFLQAPEHLADAVLAGQRALRVADAAARAYRQRKRRAAALDFQDLLILARDLLRDHDEARERLQRRYRFLLIDELQDTDPVQMELVEHLCGAELMTGKLFAVGDYKQSIYRFRGADVTLFQALRERMPHEGRLNLTVNFRSQPAILDFTNALFSRRLQAYERLEKHHSQVNPGPCVEFLWSPREEKEFVTESRTREADWIARRIAAMVGDREQLVVDRDASGRRVLRPVRPGDIVLLFRAMSSVQLYETALRNHGLDYYLVGGRAFFAQQEIYDLLNLLRALENPQDAVSLAGTLRSPFCCLSDEALFVLGRHSDGLWAGLHEGAILGRLAPEQREAAERARRFLDRWRSLKDRLPIARLLGEVLADSGYDAALQFEFLGDRKLANLWKLIDLARTFDRSTLVGLADFIRRLGDLVSTQPREEQAATQPENADVVRLMTIHQAKGLEFPVVFVPDLAATRGGGPLPPAQWDARLGCLVRPPADEDPPPFADFGWKLWKAAEEIDDWHEDLRTLYVACTRAQDYLVLSAVLPQAFRPEHPWMLALAERFDLRTGACLDAAIPREQQPKVRISDSPAAPGRDARARPDRGTEVVLLDDDLRRVEPIPVRWTGTEVIPLAALEAQLQAGEAGPPPALAAWSFDAEDGSDRTAWLPPQDRVDPSDHSGSRQRDRIVRSVLERWEWKRPDEWRSLLPEALTAESLRVEPVTVKDLEAAAGRFATSDTFRRLATADVWHRDLEFLLSWPAAWEGEPADTGRSIEGPRIAGVIDCLWRDREGWHLLAYETGERPASKKDRWRGRKPRLLLWAAAVQQHFGAWPTSVALYSFVDGVAVAATGKGLRHRPILAGIQTAITALLGQSGVD